MTVDFYKIQNRDEIILTIVIRGFLWILTTFNKVLYLTKVVCQLYMQESACLSLMKCHFQSLHQKI
jgi:hypothetical protein